MIRARSALIFRTVCLTVLAVDVWLWAFPDVLPGSHPGLGAVVGIAVSAAFVLGIAAVVTFRPEWTTRAARNPAVRPKD